MKKGWPARIAARALVVVFLAGGVWFAREQLFKEDPRDRRIAQRVRLLDAPKPPPPKIEEKPVEVRQDKEIEVEREVAKEAPGPKDPGERLGLEGDGTAGSDGFGLEARRGGRDITAIGSDKPSGGGGWGWGWYGAMIKRHWEEILRGEKRLQGKSFQVVVRLWLAADGRVAKFDLLGSSGSDDVDHALRDLLASAPPLREPPPQAMPQPVRLRVTSRLSG